MPSKTTIKNSKSSQPINPILLILLGGALFILFLALIFKVYLGFIGSGSQLSKSFMDAFVKMTPSRNSQNPISQWLEYNDDKYGFSLKYPSDYRYQDNKQNTQNIYSGTFLPTEKSRAMDGVVLRVMNKGKAKTLAEWLNAYSTEKTRKETGSINYPLMGVTVGKSVVVDGITQAAFTQNIALADIISDGTIYFLDSAVVVLVHPQGKADNNYRQMVESFKAN